MKNQFVLTLLAIIVSTFLVKAQNNTMSNLNQEEILSWLSEYNVPAVGIGIIKDGKLQECKVFGELRKSVPVNDYAIFSIASVTKPIVAMLALKLVESGQWDLEEPLSNYWIDPDVQDDVRHKLITTKQVLTHTSGLPNWRYDLPKEKLQFLFDPGTKYNYSGEGYEYLRKALENKFDLSLEQLSDSILFKPLKMIDTKYKWENKIDESRFAFRHNSDGNEYQNQGGTITSAAGGILTTVEDYANFGIHVLNGVGLSIELYNEMTHCQAPIKKNLYQGLGWQIITNEKLALFHEGGSPGVSTIVVLIPATKSGIVVFTNGDQGDEIYSKVIERYLDNGTEVVNTLNGMSYDPEQIKTISVSDEILSKYIGTYFIESFQMSVNIIYEDNIIKLESPYSKMNLYAESETKFFAKADDIRIEFVKDTNNIYNGFMMIFSGKNPEFVNKAD